MTQMKIKTCITYQAEHQFAWDYVKQLPSLSLTHSPCVSLLFKNMHKFPAVFYFSHVFTFNLWIVISATFSLLSQISCAQVFIYQHMVVLFVMNNSHKPLGVFSVPPPSHPHVAFQRSFLHFKHFTVKFPFVSAHAAAISFCPNDSLKTLMEIK